MKRFFLLYVCFLSLAVNAQQSWRLNLLSHYQDTNLAPIGNQIWNECTGYADTITHKEYAIAGSVDSVYFFDITNPTSMIKCDVEGGLSHAVNRDFEVYDHYVYCVSDNTVNGNVPGKLQIFDLQYLPDSVHKVYESDSTGWNTHTIFIDRESKRLYKCTNRFGNPPTLVNSMDIYSIQDPLNPAFLATLTPPDNAHVHECYARHDTVYCSIGYPGFIIYDVTDVSHIRQLGSLAPPYPENAYNHSSWLDSSGKYTLFTDESPEGTGIKIYDLHDPFNPVPVGAPFRDYGSPHNAYWVGRYAYVSMYYGGVNIYDLDTLENPKLIAWYRTFPQAHTQGAYEGCWGVYPFLPSGNIIASDMNTGIYLLRYSEIMGVDNQAQRTLQINTFPNPFSTILSITLISTEKQAAYLLVYDLQGKLAAEKTLDLQQGENSITLDELHNSSMGMYMIKIVTAGGVYHQSVIKN